MHCNCSASRSLQEVLQRAGSALTAHWVVRTGSTNDDAKALVRSAAGDVRLALVADRQSAGRGTRGRTWTTPAVSVLMTVAVPLPDCGGDYAGLSLVLGAACVRALQLFNGALRLKWPNDLWVNGAKTAGLLCELVRGGSGRLHAVAGIGVNIDLGAAPPTETDAPAGALLDVLPPQTDLAVLRADIAARLALALERACRDWSSASLEEVRRDWPQLDAFAGRRVCAALPTGQLLEGRTAGIGAHGELLLTDAYGFTHTLADARVRPIENE